MEITSQLEPLECSKSVTRQAGPTHSTRLKQAPSKKSPGPQMELYAQVLVVVAMLSLVKLSISRLLTTTGKLI